MYQDIRFEIARERYQSMLGEAETQRMMKESQDPRPEDQPILAWLLVGFGLAMVRAGRSISRQKFDPCAQVEAEVLEY